MRKMHRAREDARKSLHEALDKIDRVIELEEDLRWRRAGIEAAYHTVTALLELPLSPVTLISGEERPELTISFNGTKRPKRWWEFWR